MKDSKEKLLNRQQYILGVAARQAMDQDLIIEALDLIERITNFEQSIPVTIMQVFCCNPDAVLEKRALDLFKDHLGRCLKPLDLTSAALWVRNPKREWWIRSDLKQMIDDRRKYLEPSWDGEWKNPGTKGCKVQNCLFEGKQPEQVFSPEDCLVAASQSGTKKDVWLSRYLTLGGSDKDEKYLKIKIAHVAVRPTQKIDAPIKQMLIDYCNVGDIRDVRRFLSRITPTKKSSSGLELNKQLASFALLHYSSLQLEHSVEDWVHIAQCSIYLKHDVIQRIAQRGLATLERTPAAQKVFDELMNIHGKMPVSDNVVNDIGPAGNRIWQSVYKLLPIDRKASYILASYSKLESILLYSS